MPILPGTPNNINGIHPIAALIGQGGQGIGVGARMAAAKQAQDTQGVNSFLRATMQQQMQREQQALEEKKLQIGTGLKLEQMRISQENARAERAAQAEAREQSMSLARAREARAAKQFDLTYSMQKREFENKLEMQERMTNLATKMVGEFGGSSMLGDVGQVNPPADVQRDPMTDPGSELDVALDATLEAEAPPVRTIAQSPEADQSSMNAAYQKRRAFLSTRAQFAASTGNLDGTMRALDSLSEMDFEAAKLNAEKGQGRVDAANQLNMMHDARSRARDAYFGVNENFSVRDAYESDNGLKIAEAIDADFILATSEGGASAENLRLASHALNRKKAALEAEKIATQVRLRSMYDAGAAASSDEYFDMFIKPTEERSDRVDEALVKAYEALSWQEMPMKEVVELREGIQTKMRDLEIKIDGLQGIDGRQGLLQQAKSKVEELRKERKKPADKRGGLWQNDEVLDIAISNSTKLHQQALADIAESQSRMESLRQQRVKADIMLQNKRKRIATPREGSNETSPGERSVTESGEKEFGSIHMSMIRDARRGFRDEDPKKE